MSSVPRRTGQSMCLIKEEVGTIQIHTNLSDASEEIIISTSELTDKATGMIFILLERWEIQLDVQL